MRNGDSLDRVMRIILPIPVSDIGALEEMLRLERPFCTSFPDHDVYSIALYHEQKALFDTTTRMMIDRNVFARIVDLGNGVLSKEEHRIPAAILAFAQCAGIEIEPNLALYEGVASQGTERASADIGTFRAVDNLHPSVFTDIALGRSHGLVRGVIPCQHNVAVSALKKPLKQFSFVYPLVLKLAILELDGGAMGERMLRFLDWAFQDWYFSAASIALAARCFSHLTPRGALKNLRSRDRNLALQGLKNAAWDLTYITWWLQCLKRQDESKSLHVLCSCDKLLRQLAQGLLVPSDGVRRNDEHQLMNLLGTRVYDHYKELVTKIDTVARARNCKQASFTEYKTNLIESMEQEILLRAV